MEKKYQAPMNPNRKPLQELLPLGQPLSLFVDPSDACNFKCNFCFQHYRKIDAILLDEKLFEKILGDLKEFPEPFKMLHINGFGEPLLNGAIVDFIRMLKEENVAEVVEITTNGSLLTPELSERLVGAGLDKIIFSIYALQDEGYKVFSGASVSFQNVYDNIACFYKIRGGCHVHAKIAGEYFSQREREEFIEKFEPIVDTLYIDHAINAWPELKVTENEGEHMYGLGSTERICPMPFYQMVVHSDGKVSPCCVDYGKKLVMGDIREESLQDIWNGEKYQKLRRDILQGKAPDERVCARCSYPACGATVDITPYKDELLKKY